MGNKKPDFNAVYVGEFTFCIEPFSDGALSLSCGHPKLASMEADLVFASGAMSGDPVLKEQSKILECIILGLKELEKLENIKNLIDRAGMSKDFDSGYAEGRLAEKHRVAEFLGLLRR